MTFYKMAAYRLQTLCSGSLKMSCTSIWSRLNKKLMTNDASNQSPVITEKLGKIFLIGINRPEKRNCVNSETAKLLTQAIKTFEADGEVIAGILHGIGGNFCAGYDLSELSEVDSTSLPKIPSPPEGLMGPTGMMISKPIIAAVSGYAVGGGMELALMCDLRVVEDTAIMGVFNRRFGVPLIDGGTCRLPRMIGLSRALDLILTGRQIGAKEAFEFGLANRVVACGTALGQALNLARNLEKFPQECLNLDKKAAYYSTFDAKSFEDALQFERDNGLTVITKESIQGAKKFVNGVGRHGKFSLNPTEALKQ